MADIRFFKKPNPITLSALAAATGCVLKNENDGDYQIEGVAIITEGKSNHLSFLDNSKYKDAFRISGAGACIVHYDMAQDAPPEMKLLLTETPYKAYAQAAQILYPIIPPSAGIASTAKIHSTAKIGNGCNIGEYVVIGENVEIGENTWVDHHAVISAGCVIGANSYIGTHVSICCTIIGDYVRVYCGARLGQDGFGFAMSSTGYVKVPQLGRLVIEGYSEIGANTCIDRGALGDTVIGKGTWLDNQIQIAHNVKIGKGCVIAAQVGISGSTEIGDYVSIGGQAGFSGHLKIGSLARIAAKSGVTRDIPVKEEWMGYPAMPMKRFLRQIATLGRLINK